MKAFCDYQVDLKMTPEILDVYFRQNCVDFSASVGAFDDGELVGFWMNGLREEGGVKFAYDSGTAIRPEYRGQKISSQLAKRSTEILRSLGVTEYQLEVLQGNDAAKNVYLKDGFCVSREFVCMKKRDVLLQTGNSCSGFEFVETPFNVKRLVEFPKMEYEPSWQNTNLAMANIRDEVVVLEARDDSGVAAYGLMQPKRGRISQIAFRSDLWGSGFAGAFLNRLASLSATGEAVIINIDSRAQRTLSLFESAGFEILCRQYEMKKRI